MKSRKKSQSLSIHKDKLESADEGKDDLDTNQISSS